MNDSLETLVQKIGNWGVQRNITTLGGATPESQMHKCMEEVIEWFQAEHRLEFLCNNRGKLQHECYESFEYAAFYDGLDAFGDILVCLIQAMRLSNVSMQDCLSHAWEQIKDRKGTMVNGKFVKEPE